MLALQLPFAMFPLLHFTSSRKRMGKWRIGWFLLIAGWGSALLITAMDLYGLPDSLVQAWKVIIGGPSASLDRPRMHIHPMSSGRIPKARSYLGARRLGDIFSFAQSRITLGESPG